MNSFFIAPSSFTIGERLSQTDQKIQCPSVHHDFMLLNIIWILVLARHGSMEQVVLGIFFFDTPKS